jgi:hypothetical protein
MRTEKEKEKEKEETKNKKPSAMSFEGKRFSIGIFSTASVLAVLIMFIVVNLIASNFMISIDLTSDGRYSISGESRTILRNVNEPVTIYTLFRLGEESFEIQEIINQYSAASPHVRVINRDPYIYSEFVRHYAEVNRISIPPGSIIVESDRRHRVILVDELVGVRIDPVTFQGYWELELEPRISNAITFVTQEAELFAYELTGPGKTPLSDSMKAFMRDAGYEVRQHNTLIGPIPDDCHILIITTPSIDVTRDEANTIREYMNPEGRAGSVMFIIGETNTRLPNLMEIIEEHGLTVQTTIRVHDPQQSLHPHTTQLLPNMVGHTITTRVQNMAQNILFFPGSVPIRQVAGAPIPDNINVTALIRTSQNAFIKTSRGLSMEFEPGDTPGQFNVAVAVSNEYIARGRPFSSRFIIISNDNIMDDEHAWTLNRQYLVAAMNWLINRPENETFIPSRSLTAPPRVVFGSTHTIFIKIFTWVAFPAVLFGSGVGIWLYRRNK